jgi:hypothetical protein
MTAMRDEVGAELTRRNGRGKRYVTTALELLEYFSSMCFPLRHPLARLDPDTPQPNLDYTKETAQREGVNLNTYDQLRPFLLRTLLSCGLAVPPEVRSRDGGIIRITAYDRAEMITKDELLSWVKGIYGPSKPSPNGRGEIASPDTGQTTKGNTKGKNIEAKMLKEMADNPESHGWSARKWGRRLRCSHTTILGLAIWKRLAEARALAAVEEAQRMDRSGTRPKGRRKSQHRSQA